jgi:RNA polymerase sigma factor (sigma-70 family)
MALSLSALPMTEKDRDITATVLRERSRLGNFIRTRVRSASEAEDILQDVFQQFVEAYRQPAPIEQASAWLYRVARNRIVDRFRKKKEESFADAAGDLDGDDGDGRASNLDFSLPDSGGGPEAEYARAALLRALQQAIGELPPDQSDVFIAHELEGISFKEMAVRDGVSVNTLLARKRYAVLYLRTRLQPVYDELEL